MLPYKALYLDIDGTLVDRRRRFHPLTLIALRRLEARGVTIGLATGRSFVSASPYAEAIGATLPLVLYNGAQVVNPSSGRLLHHAPLPIDTAIRALRLAAAWGVHANLYAGGEVLIEALTATALESMRKDGVTARAVGPLDLALQGLGQDPTKILLIAEADLLEDLADELRSGGGPHAPELVRSEETYLEILGQGVSKGQGVLRALTMSDLEPQAVVAFGDGLNDKEMLQAVGLGIAMGNAPPELQRAAHRTIGENDSNALGLVLMEIFGLDADPKAITSPQ